MAADYDVTGDGRNALALLLDDGFLTKTIKVFRRSFASDALSDEELRSEAQSFLLEGRYRPRRFDQAKSRHADFETALKAHAAVSLYRALRRAALAATGQGGSKRRVRELSVDPALFATNNADNPVTVSLCGPSAEEAAIRDEDRREADKRYGRLRSIVATDPWSAEGRAMRRFFDAAEKTGDPKAALRYAGLTVDMIRRIRARYGPFVNGAGGDKE